MMTRKRKSDITGTPSRYRALLSSDWNECLAPCGPFDAISYTYPELEPALTTIFRHYTGNRISLGEAAHQIRRVIPEPITIEQMDAYLDRSFATYPKVPELIEWCRGKNILFMINTTGMIGYFQRVFSKHLLPPVTVLSAHPMIRFPESRSDPPHVYDLFEIQDKAMNTEAVVKAFNIPRRKIILMGDSGGDGPHFEWGKRQGAFLVGSMTKPSLDQFCRNKEIVMDMRFDLSCSRGGEKTIQKEMKVDFMALADTFEEILAGP